MCTLSFIYKGNNNFLLTSSRDEAVNRRTVPPKLYQEEGVSMLYPKDELAGGTWVGVSSRNRLLCLLNGAYVKHTRKEFYRKSRGLIVKELLCVPKLTETVKSYNLNDIEPFTLVLIDWEQQLSLTELVWDGKQKQVTRLPLESKIWSSSSLYNKEMKLLREQWFVDFLSQNGTSKEELFYFHENYGIGDANIDLKIDRGFLKTVSITQFEKDDEFIGVLYKDLLNEKTQQSKFEV